MGPARKRRQDRPPLSQEADRAFAGSGLDPSRLLRPGLGGAVGLAFAKVYTSKMPMTACEAGRIRRRADNGDEVGPPAGSRRFARRLTAALLVNGGYRCGEPDAGASRCSRRGTCPAGV